MIAGKFAAYVLLDDPALSRLYFAAVPDIIDPSFGSALFVMCALELMAGMTGLLLTMQDLITFFPLSGSERMHNRAIEAAVEVAGNNLRKVGLVLHAFGYDHPGLLYLGFIGYMI